MTTAGNTWWHFLQRRLLDSGCLRSPDLQEPLVQVFHRDSTGMPCYPVLVTCCCPGDTWLLILDASAASFHAAVIREGVDSLTELSISLGFLRVLRCCDGVPHFGTSNAHKFLRVALSVTGSRKKEGFHSPRRQHPAGNRVSRPPFPAISRRNCPAVWRFCYFANATDAGRWPVLKERLAVFGDWAGLDRV